MFAAHQKNTKIEIGYKKLQQNDDESLKKNQNKAHLSINHMDCSQSWQQCQMHCVRSFCNWNRKLNFSKSNNKLNETNEQINKQRNKTKRNETNKNSAKTLALEVLM